MKIWIDARSFSVNEKNFFNEFLKTLKSENTQNVINIYCNWISKINNPNFNIISSKNYVSFWWEQSLFLKRLLKDNNDVVISFEETFPIFYKNRLIQIINSLEQVLYPNIHNAKLFSKYSYLFRKKRNLKHAKKIICYHEKTKKEINEKLNIPENKIEVLKPFFYNSLPSNSLINIKNKHSISWDYLVYNSWVWNSKNIKRLLECLKEINKTTKLSLIVLWNQASSDIEFREMVINMWLTQNVIFVWEIIDNELWAYYNQSNGLVHPVIYDSFPFCLSEALNYNTPIISSSLEEIESIFGKNIQYFHALSKNDMVQNIWKLLKNEKQSQNYTKILWEYSAKNFVKNLLNII